MTRTATLLNDLILPKWPRPAELEPFLRTDQKPARPVILRRETA
ncbi:MAG TPA: hypothetical protein O0Y06_01805 [Methanocorpusculum sp.]|nr:hypothetical protein [Methanocorpusculum sp.]HJK79617.1 hypothetical protein [Methanocorpusculum sp.]